MPIKLIQNGDIFKSECDMLVNPVNCAGIMGAGLALEFKRRFPEYFEDYKKCCFHHSNPLKIGHLRFWRDRENRKNIISFPTKIRPHDSSKLDYIEDGLGTLRWVLFNESIAIPALGCGLGGLEWSDVKPLIYKHFKDYRGLVEIYEPREK